MMTPTETEPPRTSLFYILRSVLYAILSAMALFSGYIMDSGRYSLYALILLAAFLLSYFPFFVAYCAVFRRRPTDTPTEPRDAFKLAVLLATALAAVSILLIDPQDRPSPVTVLALGGVTLMFWGYGWFLLRQFHKLTPSVRHQLVWSVVLAIAVPLYIGSRTSLLATQPLVVVPVLVLASLVVASELLPMKNHILLAVSAVYLIAAIGFDLATHTNHAFLAIIGCIIVAAYVAVFEGWAVTGDLAKDENAGDPEPHTRVGRYYNATLLALLVSALAIPTVYVFTPLSYIILILLALHSSIAFFIWTAAGSKRRLVRWPWTSYKIWMGSAVLVALIFDAKFFASRSGAGHPIPMPPILFAFILFLSSPFLTQVPRIAADCREQKLAGLMSTRVRLAGIIFFLSIFGIGACVLICSEWTDNAAILARSVHSCVLYVAFWIVSFVYLLYDYFRSRPPDRSVAYVISLAMLTRLLTSLLIGAGVLTVAHTIGMSFLVAVRVAAPFVLAAMGGFALNDYCDAERDAVNRPYRPIPAGRITRTQACFTAVGLLFVAAASIISVAHTKRQWFVYGATVIGVSTYNVVVARLTVVKNLWTGALCGMPFLYFSLTADVPTVIPISISLYVVGREILMDVIDIQGDCASGVRTIAFYLGSNLSAVLGFLMAIVGAACFGLYVHIASVMVIMWVIIAASILFWARGSQRKVIYILWIPMLLGCITLGFR